MQGFGKISYDANLLEPAGFAGLRGMNIEHWYRENSTTAYPWNRVGVVRSADPWRDTLHW